MTSLQTKHCFTTHSTTLTTINGCPTHLLCSCSLCSFSLSSLSFCSNTAFMPSCFELLVIAWKKTWFSKSSAQNNTVKDLNLGPKSKKDFCICLLNRCFWPMCMTDHSNGWTIHPTLNSVGILHQLHNQRTVKYIFCGSQFCHPHCPHKSHYSTSICVKLSTH